MDEELEQRGVTPKSFFDQATETREMVQTVQKTSNSNLSLLNELKERVRKIEVKLFDEEDRRQKEEMEAKVKEQNEKTQGGNIGDKGGVKDPEQKGLMGQVGSFLSNLVGGLIGGAVGFTLSGIGGLIGGTINLGKKALDLGKSLKDKLFGKKKDKKGGKVKTDKLLGVVGGEDGEDDEKKKKENDKNLIKGELKEELKLELGIGDKIKEVGGKIKETGGNILGGIKKTLGGIKDSISNFDGRPGSRKTKGTKEIEEEQVDEKKPKYYADYIKEGVKITEIGDNDFYFEFPDGSTSTRTSTGSSNAPTIEERFDSLVDAKIRDKKEQEQRNKEREKEKLEFGKRMYKSFPDKYNPDGTRKETKEIKGKKNDKKRNKFLGLFNEGGLVQKFNQGGEVDSVPAMLTPGEFVVTKDAVQKVGVDTLKGLNASVGDTSKPELSSLEIGFGGGDMSPFEKKQTSYQGIDLGFTSTSKKTVDGEVVEDITKKEYLTPTQTKQKLTEMGIPYKELLNGTVIPDAAKMGAEKMPEFYRIAKEAIMQQIPDDLPGIPAAVKVEYKKLQETALKELDKFMTQMAGGGDFTDTAQIEAEMNRYVPGTIENLGLQITESANKSKPKKKGLFSLGSQTQNFNEGGLVQPVIESKNESGEMELINNLSQLVEGNSQNINVIQAQNQAMSPPNKSPQTTVPAEPSNTTLTGLQDTDAPIPFAVLLRQNAQRYLNLGNNAMVVS